MAEQRLGRGLRRRRHHARLGRRPRRGDRRGASPWAPAPATTRATTRDRPRPAGQPGRLRRLRARLGDEGRHAARPRWRRASPRPTPCSPSTGTSRPATGVVNDAHDHAPIDWTVTGILAKSSNVGTIMLAREVGDEKLEHYLRAFGLGSTTGIELPGESAGILEAVGGLDREPRGQRADRPGRLGDHPADGLDVPGHRQRRRPRRAPDRRVGHRPRRHRAPRRPTPRAHPGDQRGHRRATWPTCSRRSSATGGTAPLGADRGLPRGRQDRHRAAGQPRVRLLRRRRLRDHLRRLRPGRRPAVRRRRRPRAADQLAEGGQVAAPVFADVMRYALTADGVVPSGTPRPEFVLEAGTPRAPARRTAPGCSRAVAGRARR